LPATYKVPVGKVQLSDALPAFATIAGSAFGGLWGAAAIEVDPAAQVSGLAETRWRDGQRGAGNVSADGGQSRQATVGIGCRGNARQRRDGQRRCAGVVAMKHSPGASAKARPIQKHDRSLMPG
jgi:hypothetical protein